MTLAMRNAMIMMMTKTKATEAKEGSSRISHTIISNHSNGNNYYYINNNNYINKNYRYRYIIINTNTNTNFMLTIKLEESILKAEMTSLLYAGWSKKSLFKAVSILKKNMRSRRVTISLPITSS